MSETNDISRLEAQPLSFESEPTTIPMKKNKNTNKHAKHGPKRKNNNKNNKNKKRNKNKHAKHRPKRNNKTKLGQNYCYIVLLFLCLASVYMYSYYAVVNGSNDSVKIKIDSCLKAWKKPRTSQKQQRLWQNFQDNKQQQSATTAAECWKAYQANMMAVSEHQSAAEFIPGKSIMMAASSVKLVCNLLTPDTRVLEWGSGGSTLFFSKYVKSWDTIEHNVNWISEMLEYTKDLSNVQFHSAKHTWNHAKDSDGSYKEFREYVEVPAHFENVQSYDIVIIDGRARVECGRSVLRNRLLAENGVVLIHDWERCMYKEILDSFQVIKEDTSSKRHLGILVPVPKQH